MADTDSLVTDDIAISDGAESRRLWMGKWLSGAYLAIILVYSVVQRADLLAMRPNEFGDLLAGIFAPLAFLWLVLGFYQQGVELRNSTRALLIQAAELKSSVEQQRELVQVTKDQLEHERLRHKATELEIERRSQPKFILQATGSATTGDPHRRYYTFVLSNAGASCTDLRVKVGGRDGFARQPLFPSGDIYNFNFTYKPGDFDECPVTLTYVDQRGNEQVQERIIISDGAALTVKEHG